VAPPQARIPRDLLQFLVQKGIPALPVDARVDGGKKNCGEAAKYRSRTSFQGES